MAALGIGIEGGDSGAMRVNASNRPLTVMDKSSRIIWYKKYEIQLNASVEPQEVEDGGNLDITRQYAIYCGIRFPCDLRLSPGEGFLAVCDGKRFVILRRDRDNTNIHMGSAREIVWLSESRFAVMESTSKISVYHHSPNRLFLAWILPPANEFKEIRSMKTISTFERLFGGPLFSICYNEFMEFYDSADFKLIYRFHVHVKHLYWAEKGDLFAIVRDDNSVYIYTYKHGAFGFRYHLEPQGGWFESGIWVWDLFIFTCSSGTLTYCGADGTVQMAVLGGSLYIVGNHQTHDGEYIYLTDKEFNVRRYNLLPPTLSEYRTRVLNGDTEGANEILAVIPVQLRNICAHFLESHGEVEQALVVARDIDHRFELAMKSGNLDIAKEIAGVVLSNLMWTRLGELAKQSGRLEIATACSFWEINEWGSLCELYTASEDDEGLRNLATHLVQRGFSKLAYQCLVPLRHYEERDLLLLHRLQLVILTTASGVEPFIQAFKFQAMVDIK